MQENIEQHLLTCQEMFLEIQQKMDSLSALGPVSDLGTEPGQDLGADLGLVVSQQGAAELLFSKVKLLKQKLVSFQKLLQDKHEEERMVDSTETQPRQQEQEEHPPQSELRRSSSVQQIFSSPRNKFLRQNSLQQQKELEQELSEQRGLTQAIARLCSQESEVLSQPSPWWLPAGPDDVRVVDQEKKWAALHSGFLSVEKLWLLPPSEVSDFRRSDGTAGRVIVPQSLIRRLEDMGLRAASQALDEVSRQTLDEDFFLVLHDVSLSLSSIKHLLDSPEREENEGKDEETQLKLLQLQTLSAELLTLGGELSSHGSKVSAVLGSECVQRCVDDLSRVLPVVQAALSSREKRLKNLLEETEKQKDELDSSLRAIHCPCEQLTSSEELQHTFERLLHNLQELLTLGHERLTLQEEEEAELQSSSHLQQKLSSHTKFFQFLCRHCQTLQFLSRRLPESALHRWSSTVTGLRDEVTHLQQRGLEQGARMQETLQVWTQWEDDRSWTDSLLRELETSFPKMHEEEEPDCDQQLSEDICSLREIADVLVQNKARFSWTLEVGLRLQALGCRGVGVATDELQARWRALHLRVDSERTTLDRTKKLRHRLIHDSAALSEWMKKARELMNAWSQRITVAEDETDVGQRRELYLQCVALTQEFEARSGLKVAVIGAGSQLVQLEEDGRSSDRNPEETSVPYLCSIRSRLRQTEGDWSGLLAGLPVVQQALQQWWLEMMSQQGALLELQVWLGAAETRLQENRSRLDQTSSTNTELRKLLTCCKASRCELSAYQGILDHVYLPLQTCTADDDQTGRYQHIEFAEDQGRLNHRWLSFQETLNFQIRMLEQELQTRAERESRLQQINSWITDQSLWMDSAQMPSSQTELQRSMDTCQVLEDKIRLKASALQELRDRVCGVSSCDFMSRAQKSIQTCAALTQQNHLLKRRLIQTRQLWETVDKSLREMSMKTARMSQTLVYHSDPRLSLQAHKDLHGELQLLHEDTEAVDAAWDELSQSVSLLRDVISSAAAVLFAELLDRQRHCWTDVSAALHRRLYRSLEVLQVWEVHAHLAAAFSLRLQTLHDDVTSAVSETPGDDGSEEGEVAAKIQHLQNLLQITHTLQSDLQGVLEATKALCRCLEPSAAALVKTESRLLSRGVLQLSHMLTGKLSELQEELQQLQEFTDVLQSLGTDVDVWQQRLDTAVHTGDQSSLLEPSARSADLDVLNELSCSLTLGDATARRLRLLNRRWATASATAKETCSGLLTESLKHQSFQHKCESWTSFLQKMEDTVAVDVADSYLGLRLQLRTHKRFDAELSTGHQILHSVITEALQLLQRGEVDDRSDFLLKLAQLREHWQGAVRRAEQRHSLVDGLVKNWHLYGRGLRKLRRFLCDARTLLPPSGPPCCSLRQLRRSLRDLQHTELLFQRHQSSFVHTLEVGRQLFSMGDKDTQMLLQADLGTLQEEWDDLRGLLSRKLELTQDIVQNWEWCKAGLADSMLQLKDIRTRLNQSFSESDDELQSAEKFNKENEDSLVDWAESLTELSIMKTDLSQYIIADDVLLLQEQVEHLRCQWEELCLKVSLRKQEIADRLNAWIIFNQKNKELCEWLTHMENKVVHDSDLNIEEMVEKLKKDCMEEINLFSENKTHLKQLGQQLITASNKTKETEINDKLKDINDRWQHLFDHIEARVRKLKETLVTVQQLDKNMSNLRTWLSHVEAELAKPLVYDVCHGDEIQRKLSEQQDLQCDIEQHSESVASVLTLCDVLLHDADACGGGGGSDSENDAIQQTTQSLDRRWRNICAMSMERRMRIEETRRLWSKFLDDFSRFEDWLKNAEFTAASPDSADVLYTSAKEELKKFEAFQRQVHERLTQLELVNKQYRRLARENRTDAASRLKVMVHEGNHRWDELQRRVTAVLRRLKHFTSQREDFEGTREGILVWLTEMDLQLTNVEHFSESDLEDKMRQLNVFQQEITLNTNKIDALIVFGENLIQKSAPLDAVLIEDELEELHSYCQEVFGRVARFHHRLVHRCPVLEEEKDLSDRDTDMDEPADLTEGSAWRETRRKKKKEEEEAEEHIPAVGAVSAGRQVMCHLLAPPLERSGRETPVSVDSIPLEWDHTVDVGGSSLEEDDEDVNFFSTLSVKSVSEPLSWHQPDSMHRKQLPRESCRTPFHQQGYVKLMSECSGSIDRVKRVKLILNDEEEEPEEAGLSGSVSDRHSGTGVIQRWELLQAQKDDDAAPAAPDVGHDTAQWQKMTSDLCDVTSWLEQLLPELDELQRIPASTDIVDVEDNARRLKVMQKTFGHYKSLMISVNLSGRHHPHSGDLQGALSATNVGWMRACAGLESWERRLHTALLQCQEFHQTLHALLLWLAQAEKKLHVANASDAATTTPRSVLLSHRDTLTELQGDLQNRQHQVLSLQEISSHLLLEATGGDSVEAKEKVHVIGNKLCLLLRQVDADLHALQQRLNKVDTSQTTQRQEQRQDSTPRRPFLRRVLRAAFPLHLLFLVLLVLVCLVPMTENDFSCTTSNNFARSFYPMLRYTNGPPPT